VKGLENLTQLEYLNLWGNKLTSVEGLEKLTQLQSLNLEDNPDLPKEKIDELKKAVSGWRISHDYSTNAEKIEKEIRNNEYNPSFKKLTGELTKADLEKVTHLSLRGRKLTDVKGLEKLTNLKRLSLDKNPDLTKAQIDQLQKALPKCRIDSNPKK